MILKVMTIMKNIEGTPATKPAGTDGKLEPILLKDMVKDVLLAPAQNEQLSYDDKVELGKLAHKVAVATDDVELTELEMKLVVERIGRTQTIAGCHAFNQAVWG